MRKKDLYAVLFALLFLSAVYLWSLPFQKNRMPYGEVDAVSHFIVGDYTAQTDKPITKLPYFINERYGKDNAFKPGTLWYPPPYHVNFAVAQIAGGERFLPIFLLNAIECLLIIIAVFFLIEKLFGFIPAFLAALLLMFSVRDYNIYLWGQWPERMAFAYVPLILYCFYSYFTNKKPIYLYIMAVLLAINLFIHPMVFFHSVLALVVFMAFVLIKEKKFNLNLKHVALSILLFLIILSFFPYQVGNALLKTSESGDLEKGDFSRLFYWYKKPITDVGLPESHFGYANAHNGYWTLPLLLAGILFLTLRREKRDLLLLAWLVSLYIMLHLDVIGRGRSFRSLSGTAHIFYPLVVIGLIYIASFIKPGAYKRYAKYSLIALFVILAVTINGKAAYNNLKGAYPGIIRITPEQYEAAEWVKENIPEEAKIYQVGELTQAKSRWMWMLSNRAIGFKPSENADYILIDYIDRTALGDINTINQIKEVEKNINGTKIYDKNNIKVYKLGK